MAIAWLGVVLPVAACRAQPAPPDSLRRPAPEDSAGRAEPRGRAAATAPDSIRGLSKADSARIAARADSIRRAENPPGHFWERAQIPLAPLPVGLRYELSDSAITGSVEQTLRDLLLWNAPTQTIPSGAYNYPDPVGTGDLPGREPPAVLRGSVPLTVPGFPEMPPDALGPVWVARTTLRPADPLSLPSNPEGGPLLEMQLEVPDSTTPLSGVRLTDNTSKRHTEEAFLARPLSFGLLRVFYHDHKMEGREIYNREFGENLLARFDRGERWGGWRFAWSNQEMRANFLDGGLFLWNNSALEAGAAWKPGPLTADVALQTFWNRSGFAGLLRKEAVYRGLLRVSGTGTAFRPLATLQVERVRQRFNQAGVLDLDRRATGIGFAAGAEGTTTGWRFRGSAGRSAPAPGRSGWVAALDLDRTIGSGWSLFVHGDRSVRPLLLPRMGNELGTMVGQGLAVPVADPGRRLEELLRGSVALARSARSGSNLAVEARALEIRHTVSAEGGLLRYFSPNGYAFLAARHPEALDRTVRALGLTVRGRVPLRYGFRLDAQAQARTSRPGWRDQLWMTPWDGEATLTYTRLLFKGDLHGELFLRGRFSGRRATPVTVQGAGGLEDVVLGGSDRYDAGAIARVDRLTLFAMLVNLEDDAAEAAAYEGGWVYLPFRSYRIGLTWHFLN